MTPAPLSLWLMVIPENKMRALSAVRKALAFFGEPAGLEEAQQVIDTFKDDGFAFLGVTSDEKGLATLESDLADLDCGTARDIDPVKWVRGARARRMTASGSTPEQVFRTLAPGAPPEPEKAVTKVKLPIEAYETAIALMATCDGNSLRAAATARNLSVTTGNPALYKDTIRALVKVFPWLEGPARESGIEW